jgi:GTP-binding protein Era
MPNMGKSTLLNALLSDDLAIVTSRPQTTRHAILGVMSYGSTQLCLTDTPGIIGSPAYRLQEGMMDVVRSSVRDADAYLVVTDVYSGGKEEEGGGGGVAVAGGEDGGVVGTGDDNGGGLGIGDEMLDRLRRSGRPVIVCVNKVDLVSSRREDGGAAGVGNTPAQAARAVRRWRSALPDALAILPACAASGPTDPGVSALRSMLLSGEPGVLDVGSAIRALGRPVPGMFAGGGGDGTTTIPSDDVCRGIVPEGPPLYHPDFFTDRTDRFCASELIRETLFTSLGKELPYCCEVRVESFDESGRYVDDDDDDDDAGSSTIGVVRGEETKTKTNIEKAGLIKMGAIILVERDSQKGIVVGKGGAKIRDVGIDARKKLEDFFGVKVFLDLRVKVDKNWRNDVEKLKKYGYM